MTEKPVHSPTQSKRSDWIRQSVLFWSSQNSSRYDLTESPMLEDATVCLSDRPNSPLPADETNNDGELINNGRVTPISNCSHVSSEKYNDLSENEINQDSYQTSKLKQQIADFQNRLKKYASITSFSDDTASESFITSPHLTLEFPRGSSITKNPIYMKVNNLDGNEIFDTLNISCDENKQKTFDRRLNQFDITSESRLSSRAEHEKIEANIKLVQETIEEIAKTINDKEMKFKRDPNEVLLNLLLKIRPPEQQSHEDLSSSRCVTRKSNHCDCELVRGEDVSKRHERLLKNVDEMFPGGKYDPMNKQDEQKQPCDENPRGRHDSGLHSISSDSNSPYPSPTNRRVCRQHHSQEEYDSGFSDMTRVSDNVTEKTQAVSDNKIEIETFRSDRDYDSDWSPISTLSSNYTSRASTMERMRSYSVPRIFREHSALRRFSAARLDDIEIRQSLEKTEATYSDNELQAIRKFLTLTSQYFEGNANKSDNWLENDDDDSALSVLPSIKEAIEIQKRELDEQRRKQEEFLHQLGDMLVEIVSLKEEHNAVRTKQAKALGLLKKQLDIQRKNQNKAHNDILSQVSSLKERIDQSTELLPQSPRFSIPNSPTNSIIYNSSASGQLIWKVKDVMKRLSRIKSGAHEEILVSQPFHTSEYGYKLNAWLYLNGRGKMTNKYISVYVSVIVGEYDPILTWPIKPTYTFVLLDQRGNIKKRQNHVRVRRVMDIASKGENIIAKNKGIPKPSDGSKALIVGFDDFIEHKNLSENFLTDDTLFLKVDARIDE